MTKIITRRTLIKSAPAVGIVTLAAPAIVRAAALGSHPPHFTGRNGFVELVAANTTIPSFTVSGGTGGTGFPWPGQPGNLVGYAGDPGFTGTLTPHNSTFTNGGTYSQFLFDIGTGQSLNVANTGLTFNGCYFGASGGTGGLPMVVRWTGSGTGTAPTCNFCTFSPSPSANSATFSTLRPPSGGGYTTWPSLNSSAGIAESLSYNYTGWSYGIAIGSETFRSCDIWGGSNMIMFSQTNGPIIADNCWIHDPQNPSPGGDHTDGIGDVQSSGNDTVNNLTINHCTISFIGNTNAIALQMTTSDTCNNWTITNNYLGGEAYTTWFGNPPPTNFKNINFSGNVFGHLMQAQFGTMQTAFTAQFQISGSGNYWRNNTFDGGNFMLNVPGQGNILVNVPAGQFLWPDGVNHATDWTGAF